MIHFINRWNGVSIILDSHWTPPGMPPDRFEPAPELYTDACTTGFGAVWGTQWLHGKWSPAQLSEAMRGSTVSVPFLELHAIAIALTTWCSQFTGRKLTVRTDSETAMHALQGGSCPDPALMTLVRTALMLVATHQFAIRCIHIPGERNKAADRLSRDQVPDFQRLCPQHDSGPTPHMPVNTQSW